MNKIYGWAIVNGQGGILTESERFPIYWYRKVAKAINEERGFRGDIIKVEISYVPRKNE